MEFAVLTPQAQREAQRVAAAFGLKKWWRQEQDAPAGGSGPFQFEGRQGRLKFEWYQNSVGVSFIAVFQRKGDPCLITPDGALVICSETVLPNQVMLRGLYRLGFEDGVLPGLNEELNYELSVHEKLELRLSMPREFWPQKWLDE